MLGVCVRAFGGPGCAGAGAGCGCGCGLRGAELPFDPGGAIRKGKHCSREVSAAEGVPGVTRGPKGVSREMDAPSREMDAFGVRTVVAVGPKASSEGGGGDGAGRVK